MNIKNKILLTLIAIIFAICLFNTSCFAFTITDGEKTVELPDFEELETTYKNNVGDSKYDTFIVKDGSYYYLIFTLRTSDYYNSYNGTSKELYVVGSTMYSYSSSSWKVKYDFSSDTSVSTVFDCDTVLYGTHHVYDIINRVYLYNAPVIDERGTEDNTNPDSGETGNETTGGDSETDTDSDDSSGILSSITQGFENVVNFFTQLIENVGNILSYLNPFSDNFILKGVLDFLGEILSYINPFSDNFILKGVLDFLGNILSYLNPFNENFLGYKLIDLLQSLFEFLFIPEENSFTGIIDIVKSKFDFIDTIKISINSFKDLISNVGTAPKLSINVNNNKYGVKEVTLIDLEWYKPYKTYGDLVLTGFIYVFFLWRLFISIPNIIGGAAGTVQNGFKVKDGIEIDMSDFNKNFRL